MNAKHQFTGSPFSPGSPGSPFKILGAGGSSTSVQIRVQPSEQHFLVPSQSASNKHDCAVSLGGHSVLSTGFSVGQKPGLASIKK